MIKHITSISSSKYKRSWNLGNLYIELYPDFWPYYIDSQSKQTGCLVSPLWEKSRAMSYALHRSFDCYSFIGWLMKRWQNGNLWLIYDVLAVTITLHRSLRANNMSSYNGNVLTRNLLIASNTHNIINVYCWY